MANLPENIIQKALRLVKSLIRESKRYLKNKEKLTHLLKEAISRGNVGHKNLTNVWEGFNLLVRLVKAWESRKYRRIPQKSLVAIVAAILYLVNPLDVIPDFLPGVGYIDDAAVLAWVLKLIADDLDEFRRWEAGDGNAL